MEHWVREIEESINDSKVEMEGVEGSCSRICRVISNSFESLPLLARHRMVKNILQKHFSSSLHALSLQTYTEKEWENERSNSKGY
jgi:stress-induced morphogen